MGLGPNGDSLLDRTGRALVAIDGDSEPFHMILEQQARSEARHAARMWYLMRHKKAAKPLAPVEAEPKIKGQPRMWRWLGENIESKGLVKYGIYDGPFVRQAGFKLPKISKEGKHAEG